MIPGRVKKLREGVLKLIARKDIFAPLGQVGLKCIAAPLENSTVTLAKVLRPLVSIVTMEKSVLIAQRQTMAQAIVGSVTIV